MANGINLLSDDTQTFQLFTEIIDLTDAEPSSTLFVDAANMASDDQYSDDARVAHKTIPEKPKRRAPSRVYVCEFCDFSFTRRWNYKMHRKRHFPRSRDHPCKKCSKSFYRETDLARHMLTHEPTAIFDCGCGKVFARKDALNRHRRRLGCPSEKP